MFYTFQMTLQVFSIRASLSYDRPDAVYCAVVPVGCSCRLFISVDLLEACVSTVNSVVMLPELRNELFAFAAFLNVVLHPSANLRLRGKESTGEPGQQFADKRGAALDFHFCLIEHAAVYFSIKMEQVANLES